MYGIVNQAMEDLVKTNFGEQAWHEVLATAGIEDLVIVDRQNYTDELTFSLVHAACEVFMQSPEIVLRLFGRHWILYTGREGWHEFFDLQCTSVIAFLEALNTMHQRIVEVMPDASPPGCRVKKVAVGYELDYHSERDGLAMFFQGIIEGLSEYYEEPWVVDQIRTKADHGVDRFRLRPVASVLKNPPRQNLA